MIFENDCWDDEVNQDVEDNEGSAPVTFDAPGWASDVLEDDFDDDFNPADGFGPLDDCDYNLEELDAYNEAA